MDTTSAAHGPWRPCLASLTLGLWLIASAFLWPHNGLHLLNNCVVGGLTVLAACATFARAGARYFIALLGIWLYSTAGAFSSISALTVLNNVLVAVLMLVVSVVLADQHAPLHPGNAGR